MQVAIRRVLPIARQRLARPQRFGPPTSTRLRFCTPTTRCFSHTPAFLQTPDDGATAAASPAEATVATTAEDSNRPMEKKEGAAPPGEQPEAAEGGESTYVPEVPHEEMINGILTASGGSDVAGERPVRRGRPAGTKPRTVVRKTVQVPKPVLPAWFVERAVVLREDNDSKLKASRLGIYSTPKAPVTTESAAVEEPEKVTIQPATELGTETATTETTATETALPETAAEESEESPAPKERYQLHESVWKEITSNVRTGLLLPKEAFADGLASTKSHCLLYLPKEGGLYYLDAVAEKLAAEVGADLIRIDAQDMAEIAGDYLGDSRHVSRSDISPVGIRSLAYDTQVTVNRGPIVEGDENNVPAEEEESYEEEDDMPEPPSMPPILNASALLTSLPSHFRQLFRSGPFVGAALLPTGDGSEGYPGTPTKEQLLDRLNERKLACLLEVIITAGQAKRASQPPSPLPSDLTTEIPKATLNKTIIHIRDYRELERTNSGEALLKMLHNIVQDRRREGDRIIVLGTTSVEEELSTYTKYGVRTLQSRSEESVERTIVVTPVFGEVENAIFKEDRDARIREVNIRHLRDVIRRRSGENGEAATLVVPKNWHLNPIEGLELKIPGIDKSFWGFDRVHRVATVALGQVHNLPSEITLADIAHAVQIIDMSDSIKFQWVAQEQGYLKERHQVDVSEETEKKTKPIPKNLTTHEKKLVSGIIDPKDIHTGFSSVRAPPETIEAMKTLTSLSLVRPEAFKYGVLATDRIPGVLLYGPPGTGKTLLARAVAKESGATVLEVSGGDVFNMYVGEGEKNVKAIFSLAKKLSPCVVFIDEADAIFGSRQSFSSRSSHREIINQFLKEWADMDSTAFIMVATNRPFDLDDAILRRLPRRILIDLPTPEDRLEILKIHLAAETVDESVDLKEIADQSSLYSGSDLKNLCVSAALTCVKEENAEFERTGKYPEKRILSKRHFDKAAQEIGASISDDMGSLGMIRKFDEKYGERIGRKKKAKSTWGFEQGQSEAAKRGEGRVRID